MYQQNHVGVHRSDDGGHSWSEITDGLPSEFGFAAAAHPHDRDTLLRDPARSRVTPAACRRATPRSGAHATAARAGSGSTAGCPRSDAHLGVLRAAMAIDEHDVPGLYFGTSTGQVFASADEGESWSEIAELPAADLVGRGRGDRELPWPSSTCPMTLTPLFAGLPRRVEIDAATVDEAIEQLERALAGRCATGSASRARCSGQHIHVYVDRRRAALDTPLDRARASTCRRDQRRLSAAPHSKALAADPRRAGRCRARRAGRPPRRPRTRRSPRGLRPAADARAQRLVDVGEPFGAARGVGRAARRIRDQAHGRRIGRHRDRVEVEPEAGETTPFGVPSATR